MGDNRKKALQPAQHLAAERVTLDMGIRPSSRLIEDLESEPKRLSHTPSESVRLQVDLGREQEQLTKDGLAEYMLGIC